MFIMSKCLQLQLQIFTHFKFKTQSHKTHRNFTLFYTRWSEVLLQARPIFYHNGMTFIISTNAVYTHDHIVDPSKPFLKFFFPMRPSAVHRPAKEGSPVNTSVCPLVRRPLFEALLLACLRRLERHAILLLTIIVLRSLGEIASGPR